MAVVSDPATNVTVNGATLNGHGNAVPATDNITILWGLETGAPYEHVSTPVAGDVASPQAVSLDVSGVPDDAQIYYVLQQRTTAGDTLVATSAEQKARLISTEGTPGCNPPCVANTGTTFPWVLAPPYVAPSPLT